MNRVEVIQKLIDKIKAKNYLEIGVLGGACFLGIKARKKMGVDPKLLIPKKIKIMSYINNPFTRYYEITSDEFFNQRQGLLKSIGLDVVFIDGLHTYKQSYNDVQNALKHLNGKGIIIMHDCNPTCEAAAFPAESLEHANNLNLPGWTGEWTGDAWKTMVRLRSTRDDLNVFVLNCDYGLGIIRKGKPESKLNYSVIEIENMLYKDLEKNRIQMLNLKPEEYFKEFLEQI
jgi:hypothetical protein